MRKKMKLTKKGQVGNVLNALPGIAIAFVVAAVVFAVGLLITSDVGNETGDSDCSGYWNESSSQCEVSTTNNTLLSANSVAYNSTTNAIEGMSNVTGKFPLFGTIIGAVIVITLIIGGLYFGRRRY